MTNTGGIEAEEVALFYKKRWTVELLLKKEEELSATIISMAKTKIRYAYRYGAL